MEAVIIIIRIALLMMTICVRRCCCDTRAVNAHTCSASRETFGLTCDYEGSGVYEPDRKQAGVKSVTFAGFEARGVRINLPLSLVPDLTTVLISGDGPLCASVETGAGVVVYFNGRLCVSFNLLNNSRIYFV